MFPAGPPGVGRAPGVSPMVSPPHPAFPRVSPASSTTVKPGPDTVGAPRKLGDTMRGCESPGPQAPAGRLPSSTLAHTHTQTPPTLTAPAEVLGGAAGGERVWRERAGQGQAGVTAAQ